MVNKKVVAICSIIAIIVVAIIVAIQIKIFNTQEQEYESDLKLVNEVESYDEDEQNEPEEDDNNDENTDNESTSTTQNQTLEQNSTDYHGEEETSSSDATVNGENAEEQALFLVKEDWGEDDSVYYTVDNQSGNIYNISVRSKSTTATLAEYEVDMSTGTIVLK